MAGEGGAVVAAGERSAVIAAAAGERGAVVARVTGEGGAALVQRRHLGARLAFRPEKKK